MIEPSLERRLTSAQEAITVLQRDFAPVAIQKPAISKIRLTKDGNYLKIFIPPVGFHPLFGMGSLFAIAWNSFILLWTVGVMLTPFPSNIPLALISLPFWGASFLMGNTVLFALFLGIYLRVDQKHITLTWEILGWKFPRNRPAPRQKITNLVYNPKHSTSDFLGAKTEVPTGNINCVASVGALIQKQKYNG